MAEDKDGVLWIGTTDGLLSMIKTTERLSNTKQIHQIVISAIIISVAFMIDKNGVLWIGTHGGGLNAFDRIYRKNSQVYRQ